MRKVTAIYPGSFDPPTNGHLDLIERGSHIFEELVVAILRNADKTPLFSVGERRAMLEDLTAKFKNVRVDTFDGLTVDYAAKVRAGAVLRGIRALSDYEYELQMALMNRKLRPDLETVFMMPAEQVFVSQFAAGAGSGAVGRRRSANWSLKLWNSGSRRNLIPRTSFKLEK